MSKISLWSLILFAILSPGILRGENTRIQSNTTDSTYLDTNTAPLKFGCLAGRCVGSGPEGDCREDDDCWSCGSGANKGQCLPNRLGRISCTSTNSVPCTTCDSATGTCVAGGDTDISCEGRNKMCTHCEGSKCVLGTPRDKEFPCELQDPKSCYTCKEGKCLEEGDGLILCHGNDNHCNVCDFSLGKCVTRDANFGTNEGTDCDPTDNDGCLSCSAGRCMIGGGGDEHCLLSNYNCASCDLSTGRCTPSRQGSIPCDVDHEEKRCFSCSNGRCVARGDGVHPCWGEQRRCSRCNLSTGKCVQGFQADGPLCDFENPEKSCYSCKGPKCVEHGDGRIACYGEDESCVETETLNSGAPQSVPVNGMSSSAVGNSYQALELDREKFDSYFSKSNVNHIFLEGGSDNPLRVMVLTDPHCGPGAYATREMITAIRTANGGPGPKTSLLLVGYPLGGSGDSVTNIHYWLCTEQLSGRGSEFIANFINDRSKLELKQKLNRTLDEMKYSPESRQKIESCIASGRFSEQILKDYDFFTNTLGVKGTPTIFFQKNRTDPKVRELLPFDPQEFTSLLK